MLATCDDSLEGLRDRALLCFGFASGGRRRSEIAAADMRDLRKTGDEGYIYRLEYSKTQQAGVTVDSTPDKPVLGSSAVALSAWLDAAKIVEGAIFRRMWGTGLALPCCPVRWQLSSNAGPRWRGLWGTLGHTVYGRAL